MKILGVTAAGVELGLTQSAISLHIKALEADLGRRLFVRRGASLELTDHGHAYLMNVARSLGDLENSTRRMFGAKNERIITVRTSISTATLWLSRLLPDFYKHHPDIKVRLLTTIWADGANQADVDIELRLGTLDVPPDKFDFSVEEPITLVTTQPDVGRIENLEQVGLIGILGHEADWDQFHKLHDCTRSAPFSYEFDTTLCAYSLLQAGTGCGLILKRYLNPNDGLFTPFDTFFTNHVHYVRLRHNNPDIHIFGEWLCEHLKQS